MYTLSRAQRTEQQRAATYYGLAGSSSLAIFVVFVFDPFSEALPIGFFSDVLLGSAFFLSSCPFSASSIHHRLLSHQHPENRSPYDMHYNAGQT